MKQALLRATTAVAVCLAVAAVARIVNTEAVATAASSFSLEVDAEPAGNTGDSLGPTEVCRQVGVGESFKVDIVAKEAPPLFGVEVSFLYDPAILRIKAIQVDSGLFLGKKQGSSLFNLSERTPDEDGSYRAFAADLNLTGPSGNGAVFRLTLDAKARGTSAFTIATDDPETFFDEGPVIPSTQGDPLMPALSGAEIRVGQPTPCPAPPPPSTKPTPTPTPAPPTDGGTPEPTRTPTPGGATPRPTPVTPQTKLSADLGARDRQLVVEDAGAFQPGDIIQVGEEKMRVISTSGNVLQVERGVEGTEATEHKSDETVLKVDEQAEDSTPETDAEPTGAGGADSGGDTDLTGMPWLAVWATLGGLAAAAGLFWLLRARLL